MRITPSYSVCAVLASLACLAPTIASASLGGAPSSFGNAQAVQARQLAAAGPAGSTSASGYTVNESTLDSGTVVREYVGANGTVFAVSWNGPFLPDLRTLLGSQFSTLTAAHASRAGRGPVRVERSDVVIESSGHMRAYTGRAWLTSALPAGFDTGAIQ